MEAVRSDLKTVASSTELHLLTLWVSAMEEHMGRVHEVLQLAAKEK